MGLPPQPPGAYPEHQGGRLPSQLSQGDQCLNASNHDICLQIHESGRLLCVGAADGTTSLIQLDESLASCSKLDRTNANDMFDR